MKKKKSLMFLIIALMVIGFAAVATTLYINGSALISGDQSEFDVYYSKTIVNGEEDNSVITNDNHIVFKTDMKSVGDSYEIEYYITNGSKNYDADVTMNCTAGNDYVRVTNNWVDHTVIDSTDTKSGLLTLEMIKGYTGDDPLELKVECEITAAAVERESLGTGIPADKVQHSTKAWVAVTGDGTQVGDEIAVGEEHFYVISNDGESLKALAKYNLNVGNEYDVESHDTTPLTNPTGIQSPLARGYVDGADKFIGIVAFSNNKGWPYKNNDDINIKEYDGPVKTALYDETTGYESYIQKTIPNAIVRLITKSELEDLGCSSEAQYCTSHFEYTCDDWDVENDYNGCSTHQEGETITVQTGATAPEWVYSTSFWSGSADSNYDRGVWFVRSNGNFNYNNFGYGINFGVRPVIILES